MRDSSWPDEVSGLTDCSSAPKRRRTSVRDIVSLVTSRTAGTVSATHLPHSNSTQFGVQTSFVPSSDNSVQSGLVWSDNQHPTNLFHTNRNITSSTSFWSSRQAFTNQTVNPTHSLESSFRHVSNVNNGVRNTEDSRSFDVMYRNTGLQHHSSQFQHNRSSTEVGYFHTSRPPNNPRSASQMMIPIACSNAITTQQLPYQSQTVVNSSHQLLRPSPSSTIHQRIPPIVMAAQAQLLRSAASTSNAIQFGHVVNNVNSFLSSSRESIVIPANNQSTLPVFVPAQLTANSGVAVNTPSSLVRDLHQLVAIPVVNGLPFANSTATSINPRNSFPQRHALVSGQNNVVLTSPSPILPISLTTSHPTVSLTTDAATPINHHYYLDQFARHNQVYQHRIHPVAYPHPYYPSAMTATAGITNCNVVLSSIPYAQARPIVAPIISPPLVHPRPVDGINSRTTSTYFIRTDARSMASTQSPPLHAHLYFPSTQIHFGLSNAPTAGVNDPVARRSDPALVPLRTVDGMPPPNASSSPPLSNHRMRVCQTCGETARPPPPPLIDNRPIALVTPPAGAFTSNALEGVHQTLLQLTQTQLPPPLYSNLVDVARSSTTTSSFVESIIAAFELSQYMAVFNGDELDDPWYSMGSNGLSSDEFDFLPIRIWLCAAGDDKDAVKRDDKGDRCMICLDEYVDEVELRTLKCQHEFHLECVDRWLKDKRTCPLCRADAISGTP